MYASKSPNKEPTKEKPKKYLVKLLSIREKNWIMPTAKTNPGRAYPIERNWLDNFKKFPPPNLFKMLMNKAKIVQIIPEISPIVAVLNKLFKIFVEKKYSEG